jgi:hypothetical protein
MEDEGWELLPKHVFILSSSGKPIFSRYGDEQELVTTFGLLQAVVSIVEGQGDSIKCIQAGKRRIVCFLRKSLYFIAISSTGETEAALMRQLEFMYNQVLLVLTDRVHDILDHNSSKDLRDLLGSDTTRLLRASCAEEITSYCIAFNAVQGFALEEATRSEIRTYLDECVSSSGAAMGMMIHGDAMLTYCLNEETPLNLEADDVLQICHFVGNSNSLRTHDQNWVPLCLPKFNSKAMLQAYVCNIHLDDTQDSEGSFDISLILISPDPSLFKELHEGREALQTKLQSPQAGLTDKLVRSVETQRGSLSKFLASTQCLHFFYKIQSSGGGDDDEDGSLNERPAQCYSSKMEFPLDSKEMQNLIWSHYQRLALCLRVGSSTAEASLVNLEEESVFHGMSMNPSPSHAVSYAVLDSGQVVVGLATSDSELYTTFPETMSGLDACSLTHTLQRSLRADRGLSL